MITNYIYYFSFLPIFSHTNEKSLGKSITEHNSNLYFCCQVPRVYTFASSSKDHETSHKRLS